MRLYESVYITRPDISSADVDKLTDAFIGIITSMGGELIKQEYWGLRQLAYEIKQNKRGHYVMLVIKAGNDAINELKRKMSLSEDVIRFMTLKIDTVDEEISPILKGREESASVDVTVSSDNN